MLGPPTGRGHRRGIQTADGCLAQTRLAIALDNLEEAKRLLYASHENHDAELPYLAVDPRFDSIREMLQFADLVIEIRSSNPD